MTKEIQSLIEVSKKSVEQLRQMLSLEDEKRRALVASDTEKIETILKQQQAAIMMLENLEKRRIDAQNAAGYGGFTASQIIERTTDADAKRELSAALDEMTKIVGEIKSLNDASMEIASSNLQMYETIMNGSKARKTQATYDTRGHKETNSTNSTFEEKI